MIVDLSVSIILFIPPARPCYLYSFFRPPVGLFGAVRPLCTDRPRPVGFFADPIPPQSRLFNLSSRTLDWIFCSSRSFFPVGLWSGLLLLCLGGSPAWPTFFLSCRFSWAFWTASGHAVFGVVSVAVSFPLGPCGVCLVVDWFLGVFVSLVPSVSLGGGRRVGFPPFFCSPLHRKLL